jgi:transcription factor STE12
MSSSVMPVPEADESTHNSPQSNTNYSHVVDQKPAMDHLSRTGTPLHTVEDSPPQQQVSHLSHDDLSSLVNGDAYDTPLQHAAVSRTAAAPGVFRRARSATMMELGPYPTKSHSCPIPTCGRLFKRLEHLKR